MLTNYVKAYSDWAGVVEQLTDLETGRNVQYERAKQTIDELNLTADQIDFVLEMSPKSPKRAKEIDGLKANFTDRANEIDRTIAAFDEYRPFRGRLDDPKDLQRMLKGAGILEFRILPTLGHPTVDEGEMNRYVETLREKGPKYASDNRYRWCEIEEADTWSAGDAENRPPVVADFADLRHPDQCLAQLQLGAHRQIDQAQPRGRDVLGKLPGFEAAPFRRREPVDALLGKKAHLATARAVMGVPRHTPGVNCDLGDRTLCGSLLC